jgi:hypothetical protein
VAAEPAKPAAAAPAVQETANLAATAPVQLSEADRAAMRRKIDQERAALNSTIDPAEIERRRAIFQKRKEELASQRREQCREQIDLELSKHEQPVPQADENALDALRRALAGRVRAIIEEA